MQASFVYENASDKRVGEGVSVAVNVLCFVIFHTTLPSQDLK